MAQPSNFTFIQQGKVATSNYRPLLYSVASGSYAASWVHSPYIPQTADYSVPQLAATNYAGTMTATLTSTVPQFGQSYANVVTNGNQASFDLQIDLDLGDGIPLTATLNEIRIRCVANVGNVAASTTAVPQVGYAGTAQGALTTWYKNAPAPISKNTNFGVDIYDLRTGASILGTISSPSGQEWYAVGYKAQILQDGTWALLKEILIATITGGNVTAINTVINALTTQDMYVMAGQANSDGQGSTTNGAMRIALHGQYLTQATPIPFLQ